MPGFAQGAVHQCKEKVIEGEIVDRECILCGNCIDACKFNALTYRISKPADLT